MSCHWTWHSAAIDADQVTTAPQAGVGESGGARVVLARHAARRAQGIPTVTVLIGDVTTATTLLADLQVPEGPRVVLTTEATAAALVRDLLRALTEQQDVSRLAFERAAATLGDQVE